jgi:hypothetical protein
LEDCHIDRNKGTNYGILNPAGEVIGWIIYDEKYDKEDGEGNDIDIECLGCITLVQGAGPSENYANVYQGMKSVWEDIRYILLISRMSVAGNLCRKLIADLEWHLSRVDTYYLVKPKYG